MLFLLVFVLKNLLIGYLLGSIPFGLLLTRAAGLGDVRSIGSGNIGATNVLRTGNMRLAALTLLLDGLKGTAAVLLAPHLGGSVDGALFAGVGAFLGHIFPVWLGFKGGKGVATYIGVLFGLAWPAGVAFCLAWLLVAVATRFSSLAALIASALVPIVALYASPPWWSPQIFAVVFAAMTLLLFWTHRENIKRLIAGTESRIGAKG